MNSKSEIQIVKAGLEHEDGVMRASEDVYAGLDYLPSLYKTWIHEGDRQDPRRFNFVVLIDSDVGGFFSLLFSQDKSKFLSSAQRVAKDNRAKGIGTKINEFIANFAKSVNKGVEQLISFADAWLGEESLKKKIINEVGIILFDHFAKFLVSLGRSSCECQRSFDELSTKICRKCD